MSKIVNNKYKKELSRNIYEINRVLKSLDNTIIDNKKSKIPDKVKKSFNNISSIIASGLLSTKKGLSEMKKNVDWEHLNIAFYGETNAGKSTLIEALISGRGDSIGEGYKDYTKTVTEINSDKMHYLDMPGIEGRNNKLS